MIYRLLVCWLRFFLLRLLKYQITVHELPAHTQETHQQCRPGIQGPRTTRTHTGNTVTLPALSAEASDFSGYSQSIATGLTQKPPSAVTGCPSVIKSVNKHLRESLTSYVQILNRNALRVPALYPRPIGRGFTTILLTLNH